MAWDTEWLDMLRVLVDDVEAAVYTDDKLLSALALAAFQVDQTVGLGNDYTVSVSNQTVSPDPTAAATLDESFTNLATLKAAAIIDRGSAMTAAQRAISVKDGGSAVDLRGVFQAKFDLLKEGWGKVYEDALFEYRMGQSRVAGAAVLTPFRLYAGGNPSARR